MYMQLELLIWKFFMWLDINVRDAAVNTFTSVMVANGKFLISFIPLSKLVKLWINENDSIMLSAVCIILKS